mmetsp:Transcript_7605/g.27132  ORF Transcript_7605/g.27132 Transcript_7605/m.27132 type:complete len:229 (-) Transcript_7605:98-784(-)
MFHSSDHASSHSMSSPASYHARTPPSSTRTRSNPASTNVYAACRDRVIFPFFTEVSIVASRRGHVPPRHINTTSFSVLLTVDIPSVFWIASSACFKNSGFSSVPWSTPKAKNAALRATLSGSHPWILRNRGTLCAPWAHPPRYSSHGRTSTSTHLSFPCASLAFMGAMGRTRASSKVCMSSFIRKRCKLFCPAHASTMTLTFLLLVLFLALQVACRFSRFFVHPPCNT